MATLAIIGGGAAGLAAAVEAGRAARAAGLALDITIFERDARVGRSILRSGNGRCNFSNANISADKYTNSSFVRDALNELPAYEVWAFFERLGLAWSQESEGRMYPSTRKAATVLAVLRAAAAEYGVVERCDTTVERIDMPGSRGKNKVFTLTLEGGEFVRADAVIVAVGGHDGLALLPESVRQVSFEPTLGPIKTSGVNLKNLDNTRVKADITLVRVGKKKTEKPITESGEIMFRKYGVSGIAAFNISRFARPGDTLLLNLFPQIPAAALSVWLQTRADNLAESYKRVDVATLLRGLVLPAVAHTVCSAAHVDEKMNVSKMSYEQWGALSGALSALELTVVGNGDVALCQVNRGGVCVDQVSPLSMAVRAKRGLYVVGEALDVDAPCGGFNLHWAWVSGMLAGRDVVELLA